MTPEQWELVESLFCELISAAPDQRESLLRRDCGDEAIRDEVRSLLAYDRDESEHLVHAAVADAATAVAANQKPQTFTGTDRFEILREIGTGGFGTVYEAYDREQRTLVALKVLFRAASVPQFKREFRALADVTHENLVRLYELFIDGEAPFFTMELVEGCDFRNAVKHRPPCDTVPLFLQLARAVDALHRSGLLHCDLKPGNVLVTPAGRVVVLDFGLVRAADGSGINRFPCGTPGYSSPEQIGGSALTSASDWYSVGTIIKESVEGFAPIQDKTFWALVGMCDGLMREQPLERLAGSEVLARLERLAGVDRDMDARWELADAFAGRDSELASLRNSFLESTRQPVVQLVSGPPGIGKTTLVRHFVDELSAAGNLVLSSRCRERESVAFKAFDDVLEEIDRYLGAAEGDEADSLADLMLITRLLQPLGRAPSQAGVSQTPPTNLPERRRSTFDALRRLLGMLAQRQPLVLWIDDVQWGDQDSAALLQHLLAPPLGLEQGLVVLSFRAADTGAQQFLKTVEGDRWQPTCAVTRRLEIGSLSAADARALARALLPAAEEHRVCRVGEESGGDPYLLIELARLSAAEDQRSTQGRVGLQELVARRITSLPVTARSLLDAAAIAERPLDWQVLRATAGDALDSYDAMLLLRSQRLLRASESSRTLSIETYHDRISEIVRQAANAETRKDVHWRIARQTETRFPDDVEALAWHYRQAGDVARAALNAELAGDRAMTSMAFATAVEHYEVAVGLAPEHGLRRKLANALASSGRAFSAAEMCEQLVTESRGQAAVELNIAAARHFFTSGHTDQGAQALRSALHSARIPMPDVSWAAILVALWTRLFAFGRLAITGVEEGRRERISPANAVKLDMCWTATFGLGLMEPMHAIAFQGHHLLLGLRFGTVRQKARALASEAIVLANMGPRFLWAADACLARALRISARLADAEGLALIQLAVGMGALSECAWRKAYICFDIAGVLYARHGSGTNWEAVTARLCAARARYHAGDIGPLTRTVPTMWKAASERGDFYEALFMLARVCVLDALTTDDREGPRGRLAAAAVQAHSAKYRLPQYLLFLSQVDLALYAGDVAGAWETIGAHLPKIRQASLLAFRYIRIEVSSRRSLVAVALCRLRPHLRRELLRIAKRERKILARQKTCWADACCETIDAALALERGDGESAAVSLRSAEELFLAAEMALCAAGARWWLEELAGGPEKELLRKEADEWMLGQGIVNPAQAARMLLPLMRSSPGG